MAEIKITYDGQTSRVGSLKLNAFSQNLNGNLRAAFRKAGSTLARAIKKNLSGRSHTRFPDNGNPFPGVVSGTLRRSVDFKMLGDHGVEVGPGGYATPYAAIQEFGGNAGRAGKTKIPARPYVKPAWEANKDDVIKQINDTIMGPIRWVYVKTF